MTEYIHRNIDSELIAWKATCLSSLADAQHRHAISGDVAMLTQHLRRVLLAIVLGYHPQRGGTTVHLVELLIMWKWL